MRRRALFIGLVSGLVAPLACNVLSGVGDLARVADSFDGSGSLPVGDGASDEGGACDDGCAPVEAGLDLDAGSGDDAADAFRGPQVVEVSAGIGQACAVISNGDLYCWGENDDGQLAMSSAGLPTVPGSSPPQPFSVTPTKISGIPAVERVYGGYGQVCAVTTGGAEFYCWGLNIAGEIGHAPGSDSACYDGNKLCVFTPTKENLSAPYGAVSTGVNTCVVSGTAKQLYCAGANASGELGIGGPDSAAHVFTAVSGMSGVVRVAAGMGDANGAEHACAVKGDGSLWCWGANNAGQLGHDPKLDVDCSVSGGVKTPCASMPVQTTLNGSAIDVAVAQGATCALLDTKPRQVVCFGDSTYGIANVTPGTSWTPAPRFTGTAGFPDRVSAYGTHICASGSSGVACWGVNEEGQLGRGTVGSGKTNPEVDPPGKVINVGASRAAVGFHFTVVASGGAAYAFGENVGGCLGHDTSKDKPVADFVFPSLTAYGNGTPMRVPGLPGP